MFGYNQGKGASFSQNTCHRHLPAKELCNEFLGKIKPKASAGDGHLKIGVQPYKRLKKIRQVPLKLFNKRYLLKDLC